MTRFLARQFSVPMDDQSYYGEIRNAFDKNAFDDKPVELKIGDRTFTLDDRMVEIVDRIVCLFAAGYGLNMEPLHSEIPVSELRSMLEPVSASVLISAIERGSIPSFFSNEERMVKIEDLIAYQNTSKSLKSIIRMSEAMDLYD